MIIRRGEAELSEATPLDAVEPAMISPLLDLPYNFAKNARRRTAPRE